MLSYAFTFRRYLAQISRCIKYPEKKRCSERRRVLAPVCRHSLRLSIKNRNKSHRGVCSLGLRCRDLDPDLHDPRCADARDQTSGIYTAGVLQHRITPVYPDVGSFVEQVEQVGQVESAQLLRLSVL
jgi:hypothetical protein